MSATNSNNSPSKTASTPAGENAIAGGSTETEQVINLHELINSSVKEQLGGFLADFKQEAMAQLPHSSKRTRLPSLNEESDEEPPKKIPAARSHADALMEKTVGSW